MSLFDFNDYRSFLGQAFSGVGMSRGSRLRLASFLNCQPSFLTQVISMKSHLSLEHAIRTSEFLKLNEVENEYFMLLVQKDKSGSPQLESYFHKKLQKIRSERDQIPARINLQTNLSVEDQMTYYSAWYYAAIHILVSVPGFETTDAIVKKTNLSGSTIKKVLSFLAERDFIRAVENGYEMGATRIHLDKKSRMLPRHHSNWRMKAIESVDQEQDDDLHYTAVLGIAKSDMRNFKQKLLEMIQSFEPVILESKQDTQVILLMDLFEA